MERWSLSMQRLMQYGLRRLSAMPRRDPLCGFVCTGTKYCVVIICAVVLPYCAVVQNM
jgi:hypothetical protein